MPSDTIIATRLRAAMTTRKINRSQLVERSGVSRGTIVNILNQGRQPEWATITKLAGPLGMKPTELSGEEEPAKPAAVTNAPQLLGWINGEFAAIAKGMQDHLETVIENEVQRRLDERWEHYITEQLSSLTDGRIKISREISRLMTVLANRPQLWQQEEIDDTPVQLADARKRKQAPGVPHNEGEPR
ncbi:MAG: helix-turn-helix transcriptional regulator [Patescibacteria group bacterium]|nr:helix-turn-helix transcriptional regulator [Patescibacteria group bacterium]